MVSDWERCSASLSNYDGGRSLVCSHSLPPATAHVPRLLLLLTLFIPSFIITTIIICFFFYFFLSFHSTLFFCCCCFFLFFLGLFIFHSLSLTLFLFNYFILFGFLLVGLKTKTNKGNTYDFWVSVGFFRAQQRSFSQYW